MMDTASQLLVWHELDQLPGHILTLDQLPGHFLTLDQLPGLI